MSRSSKIDEGWVEAIVERCAHAEVIVTLADGTRASAYLDRDHLDWLELQVGQIVAIAQIASARDPGITALG